MSIDLPLEKMSVEEKLRAMESIWDDLCSTAGSISSPEWHGDVLAERQSMREQGTDRSEYWDAAKRNIRNRVA